MKDFELDLIFNNVELFKNCNTLVIGELLRKLGKNSYKKGDIIFRQNDESNSLIIIIKGKIDLYVENQFIKTRTSYEIIGEQGIIDNTLRSTDAIAKTDTVEILKINEDIFQKLIQIDIQILRNLLHIVSSKLRQSAKYESLLLRKEKDLELEISKRTVIERKLNKTLKNLERTNKEIEEFAFALSHDLKSPLVVIISYLKYIKILYEDFVEDPEELENLSEKTIQRAYMMIDMVESLLSYTRLEGKIRPFEVCDAKLIIENAIANIENDIKNRNAKITYGDMPKNLFCDDVLIIRVFQNLIKNGIKFCKGKIPEINISVKDLGESYQFSVKDNGIGINSEDKEIIFKIFKRLNKEEFSGTGIGLSFTKKIIELHSGNIWVESEEGKGSNFHFTLPKKV